MAIFYRSVFVIHNVRFKCRDCYRLLRLAFKGLNLRDHGSKLSRETGSSAGKIAGVHMQTAVISLRTPSRFILERTSPVRTFVQELRPSRREDNLRFIRICKRSICQIHDVTFHLQYKLSNQLSHESNTLSPIRSPETNASIIHIGESPIKHEP